MPGGATCAQVADMTGADRGNTYRELSNLVAEGRIVRANKTYSLPTNEDEAGGDIPF